MGYQVRLEHRAAQPTAVVRRVANAQELSRVVPECCGIVWDALRAQNVAGAGRHVAIYWDGQIHLEVGVELAAPYQAAGEVAASSTPAGEVATTTHFGPYGQLQSAHVAIRDWCQQNGHRLAGPSWEIYGHWEDHWNRDPTQIRTDVYYLLTPDATAAP